MVNSNSTRLEGVLVRVIHRFENTSDRAVALLKLDNGKEIRVIGSVPAHAVGADVEVHGEMLEHHIHGKQLSYDENIHVKKIHDLKGIARYLVLYVDGIGETKANKIVERFGINTSKILSMFPEKLSEVGLTPDEIEIIRQSWDDNVKDRKSFQFFVKFGFGDSMIRTILQTLNPGAVEKVQQNPYSLLAVPRIGYEKADAVAAQMGLATDSPESLDAFLKYSFEKKCKETGSTCFSKEDFLVWITDNRSVSLKTAMECLDRAVNSGEVVLSSVKGIPVVFPSNLYHHEKKIATNIFRLRNIIRVELVDFNKTELNTEQQSALVKVFSHGLVVLTGPPGSGKTTVLKHVIQSAQQLGKKTVLCAPTGRAAKRMEEVTGQKAVTIHRLLESDKEGGSFNKTSSNPIDADLLIVDEFSMVDTEMGSALLDAIPTGCRVLLVGDADQLPSVGPGKILQDIIDSRTVPVQKLAQIYRQKACSRISEHAVSVLHGKTPAFPRVFDFGLSDSHLIEIPKAKTKTSKSENVDLAREEVVRLCKTVIPKQLKLNPIQDIQVLVPMRGGPCGVTELNQVLQEALNPRPAEQQRVYGNTRFHIGDRVMVMKNYLPKKLYNGDIGVIESFEEDFSLTVNFDGNQVSLRKDEVDILDLAFAQTIHKAQGGEFKAVVFVLLGRHFLFLDRNLLYTGMTRARQACVLVSSRFTVGRAAQNAKTKERQTGLLEQLKCI